MRGRFEQLLTSVTLAGILATAGTASATDAGLAKAVGPSLAIDVAAVATRLPQLHALAPALSEGTPSADLRRLLTERLPPPECKKACGRERTGHVLADELLNQLDTVPVLGTVMVPVTRGVMIPTGEGTPPLKLAVVPTQFKRGSGFVAIGRF